MTQSKDTFCEHQRPINGPCETCTALGNATVATFSLIPRLQSARLALQDCMEAEDDALDKSTLSRAQAAVKDGIEEIKRLTELVDSLGRLVEQERKKYFDVFHGPGKCDCHTSPGSFGSIQ